MLPPPVEIALLEERRQARGQETLADLSVDFAGGTMGFSGKGSWTNQATGAGLAGPVDPAEIDRFVDFYVTRGVQPQIEVCPFAHESLVRGLADRGFVVRTFENVLAHQVTPEEDFGALLLNGWPDGLTLAHVDPRRSDEVEVFVDVSTSGFRPPDAPVPETMARVARRAVQRADTDAFLARLGGTLAGASSMSTGGGIANLGGTSVLPAFRRRGLQQALIVRRLERARERGCRLVTIHSRPGIPTERNAGRLGFQVAYTKVLMVMPRPDLEASP